MPKIEKKKGDKIFRNMTLLATFNQSQEIPLKERTIIACAARFATDVSGFRRVIYRAGLHIADLRLTRDAFIKKFPNHHQTTADAGGLYKAARSNGVNLKALHMELFSSSFEQAAIMNGSTDKRLRRIIAVLSLKNNLEINIGGHWLCVTSEMFTMVHPNHIQNVIPNLTDALYSLEIDTSRVNLEEIGLEKIKAIICLSSTPTGAANNLGVLSAIPGYKKILINTVF